MIFHKNTPVIGATPTATGMSSQPTQAHTLARQLQRSAISWRQVIRRVRVSAVKNGKFDGSSPAITEESRPAKATEITNSCTPKVVRRMSLS